MSSYHVRRENWFRLLAEVSDLLVDVPRDITLMGTSESPSGRTSGKRRYLQPYSVEEYTRLHLPIILVRVFTIIPTEKVFVMCASLEEQDMASAD